MINDYDEPFHDPTNDIIASIFVFSIWVIGFCGFCVLPHALFGYLISEASDRKKLEEYLIAAMNIQTIALSLCCWMPP